MAEKENLPRKVFISRAGEDRDIARRVAGILKEAGFETFLQDDDFGHTSFMERMSQGFDHVDQGGCLIALLSDDYQRKPHCLKEARFPLIADPSNTEEKLIVCRIDGSSPKDFLKDIPYVDLSQFSPQDPEFDEAIVSAVERSFSSRKAINNLPGQIVETKINPKIEKIMILLENEDAEQYGRALLTIIALFSAIGVALLLFEQALFGWNWLFGTSHYALFDASFVVMAWCFSVLVMILVVFWQIRAAARRIEDAHLTMAQLKELRNRVADQGWQSEWFVRAVIQTATRNITSRR